jgi:hypothetical protein
MFETISDKIVLSVYSVILLISLIQTFWKNKRIDRPFAHMNAAYSDEKFESIQISFHHQRMTCYRHDQRYSHFHYPYQVLQCEDKRDPCQLNDTGSVPICTYYYFEMTNVITMVTTLIPWHYALRYFVIKLVRLVRWTLFRDDDRPRRVCCCCRPAPRLIQFIMRLQYITLWLYLFVMALLGFVWNITLFRLQVPILGSVFIPIFIAADRLCSLFWLWHLNYYKTG